MLFTPREKGLGKENFLKLGDGEEVTGIFRGEIYRLKKHWSASRSIECIGFGCPVCPAEAESNAKEKDEKKHRFAMFRFRVNFVTTINGQWVAKIFEGGGELYDTLTNLDKKFDVTKTVVDISRQGMKQNTKYQITPRPDQPLTADIESMINSVRLHGLSTKAEESVEAKKT